MCIYSLCSLQLNFAYDLIRSSSAAATVEFCWSVFLQFHIMLGPQKWDFGIFQQDFLLLSYSASTQCCWIIGESIPFYRNFIDADRTSYSNHCVWSPMQIHQDCADEQKAPS